MKHLQTDPNNKKTKLLVWSLLFLSVPVLGFAVYWATAFALRDLVLFGSALIVSVFLNQYQLRFPKTTVVLPVAGFFAFWAIFWLGPAGGILLGSAGAVVGYLFRRTETRGGLLAVASDIIATGASAFVFVTVFGQRSISGITTNGLDTATAEVILAGTMLMAGTHLVVGASLRSVYNKLEGDLTLMQTLDRELLYPAVGSLAVALAVILVSILFAHFGVEFGFVVAPVVILASIAYRIHVKRLEQKTREISDASRIHLATVEALATAIDARDQVGMGHVRRTQIYAVGLGQVMGLTDDQINALRTGALLHDIGKLAVPDHILNKPGPLTAAEMEKTKIHSSIGSSILEKVGFDYPVAPTVKYHHECWDGTGYPDGLVRDQIPLTARILSLADAFDALRGARPYRGPHKRDKAIRIIQDETGTRFDPTIVRLFLKNLNLFEAEIQREGLSYASDNLDLSEEPSRSQDYVEQIKSANREVFTLYELAREFGSSVDVDETLSMFTKKVSEFVPFKTCTVYLLDAEKKYATAIRVDGANSDTLATRRIKVGQGATGYVLKTGERAINVDPDLDFSISHVELSQQYSTMACVPLIDDETIVGAISIYSSELVKYGEEHIRLLETISRIAAEAIGRSLQHDEAKVHAMTDPMTGLPNARSLQIQFDKEIARASRGGTCFQVLMLDLDGFKAVNDSFGHKIGDRLLAEISQVILGQLRDYDFLARYGGDEFVALIPDTGAADVMDLCIRIERAVAEFSLKVDEHKSASVGVSLGAAGFPGDGESFDQMIVTADRAMYATKTRRKKIGLRPVQPAAAPQRQIYDDYAVEFDERPTGDGFIVELDESHVIASAAVN